MLEAGHHGGGPPCPFLQLRLRRTLRVLAGSAETCEAGRARGALTSEGWEMNILVALGALKFFSKAARRSDFYQRQPSILSPPLLATWPTPKGTKLPARLPSWHDRAAGPCVPSAHGTIPGRDSAPAVPAPVCPTGWEPPGQDPTSCLHGGRAATASLTATMLWRCQVKGIGEQLGEPPERRRVLVTLPSMAHPAQPTPDLAPLHKSGVVGQGTDLGTTWLHAAC